MSVPLSTNTTPRKLPRLPTGLKAWRRAVESVLQQLMRGTGAHVQIDGAQNVTTGADGAQIFRVASGAAAGAAPPLQVLSDGRVIAGTIGGVVPTISGTPITNSPAPTLSLSGSGTEHVVVTVSGSVNSTILSSRTFFHNLSSLGVSIAVTSTAPNSGDLLRSTSPFKFLLATFVDGVKTLQNGYGPIGLSWEDDLTGSGTALMAVGYASS
ncbi:MAG: hypothetical protein KCHDKBKB_03045 [Elusimicrobia bacterium]|nr:hypothetical protein [Elusimicrobiota bacterium]